MASNTWAERVADQIRRYPLLIFLFLASSVVAASGTVYGVARLAWDEYEEHYRWRDEEYEKIRQLRAGISVERYKEILGSPLFSRMSLDGSLGESSFQGRDYWVQAVYDQTGTVVMFSLTSCDAEFIPTFAVPTGQMAPRSWRITLNRSSLADAPGAPRRVMYSWLTNTGNRLFWDEHYYGNPGSYKTYYVGINDACPTASLAYEALEANNLNFYEPVEYQAEPAIAAYRSANRPNMYGEIASFVSGAHPLDVDPILENFQMGVDRILIRTVN